MMAAMLGRRRRREAARRRERRRRALWFAAASAAGEGLFLWTRTGRPGGNVVVRCRRGHLYTTLWIPAGSLKAVRLGWWRLQWCPVGRHISVVTPVRESDLPAQQRLAARQAKDLRIP
jgi:hypothetical protein